VRPGTATSRRKLLGAFYTPKDAAHYMASWALRSPSDEVLEPSLGDGRFVAAVTEVADGRGWPRPRFIACEVDGAAAAEVIGRGLLSEQEFRLGDFLQAPIRPVDVVIGNPPYVRLRAMSAIQARTALDAAEADMGEPMRSSGSVWMPFVSRAARHLRPGGRLALVLPWELTYVHYARPLWRHLAGSFGSLKVMRVRERLFAEIGQDVLLLLAADKAGVTNGVEFEAHRTVEDLMAGTPEVAARIPVDRIVAGERAFQEALLPVGTREVLHRARQLTVSARELVTFNIGYVAGDKDYFHPGEGSGLPPTSLRPALTNARRLRGGGLYTSGLPASAQSTLWLPGTPLSETEAFYERQGREAGIHLRYKCRVRDPWYVVPGVKVPDLVLSVFAQRPLLMVNDGGHVASNSLLCGFLEGVDAARFAAGWYNSLTLLNAELEVHSLGGGVLVLVPREAGNVRVPRPGTVASSALGLVEKALRAGDLDAAYQAGDASIGRALGRNSVDVLREAIHALEGWRTPKPPPRNCGRTVRSRARKCALFPQFAGAGGGGPAEE
jgi:hypothetical protein